MSSYVYSNYIIDAAKTVKTVKDRKIMKSSDSIVAINYYKASYRIETERRDDCGDYANINQKLPHPTLSHTSIPVGNYLIYSGC